KARRRDTRRGTVSRTERVRGSTLSLSLRARGDTLRRTGVSPMRSSVAPASERPVDEMKLQIASVILRYRPAAHRHAGLVHRLPTAADQIMPVGQLLAVAAQPVGAGRGQPVDLTQLLEVK